MTNRTISTAADLASLDFAKGGGLVSVIAQDATSGVVLMMAHATQEALVASLSTRVMHFWSRSRAELWQKGATSGNTLVLKSLHADCDGDSLLAQVEPTGPACHTGDETCFGMGSGFRLQERATGTSAGTSGTTLDRLAATIARRAAERPEGSYTTRLLNDANLRLKKLGEENAELVAALATEDATSATEEAADLIYHVLVALQATGVTLDEVAAQLADRAG